MTKTNSFVNMPTQCRAGSVCGGQSLPVMPKVQFYKCRRAKSEMEICLVLAVLPIVNGGDTE